MSPRLALLACLFALPLLPAPGASASEDPDAPYEAGGHSFRIEALAEREDVVWGFDFLPDGRILFTERGGAMGALDPKSGAVTAIQGVPKVWARGQGGLLDVRVAPGKGRTPRIYFAYSEPVGPETATTALASATLSGAELTQLRKLFSAHEPNSNTIHFGSRIELDGKGHLFLSVGDRDNRERAQDLAYHQGKILRLNEDGSVPKDNPFARRSGAKPEIWSYGHRSPQGLSRHPVTGELWMAEMGPRGGDELNLVKAGANYGWPVATYGREYSGPVIGVKEKEGVEPPVAHWVPSISPSGMAIYHGDAFPKWKGSAFLANLSGMHLRRIALGGRKVVAQEEMLKDLSQRFRQVRQGPDGYLYFSTDGGLIARLVPAPPKASGKQ
jgi:aldose sugar dehydrogenase